MGFIMGPGCSEPGGTLRVTARRPCWRADRLLPPPACAAHDLADTATTAELLALLDRYRPGQLTPMQRAEPDLARARLTAAGTGPDNGAAFPAAITGLRQHFTPCHLAHGLLDHARHLLRTGDDEAAGARLTRPAISPSGWAASRCWAAQNHPARQHRRCGLVTAS